MKKYLLLFSFIIIFGITACSDTYNQQYPTPSPTTQSIVPTPTPTEPSSPTSPSESPANPPSPTSPTPAPSGATNWNEYKNNIFSLKIPNEVKITNLCKTPSTDQSSTEAIKVFDAKNGVFYIGTPYHYEENAKKECTKVEHSANFYTQKGIKDTTYWVTYYKNNLKDDQALTLFLQDRYGKGCQLDQKVETGQQGAFLIQTKNDPKETGKTQCRLDSGYKVFYDPAKKTAVIMILGNSPTFLGSDGTNYDQDIVGSLRFVE